MTVFKSERVVFEKIWYLRKFWILKSYNWKVLIWESKYSPLKKIERETFDYWEKFEFENRRFWTWIWKTEFDHLKKMILIIKNLIVENLNSMPAGWWIGFRYES